MSLTRLESELEVGIGDGSHGLELLGFRHGSPRRNPELQDRATGHGCGFSFVAFADPVDRCRTVEAKKAVRRDDQNILNRNNSSIHESPSPARTKKLFVGGLASTVTESDFNKYFDQFGIITYVVVMYDHNTQRPRGFGFITYDSEEAVEKVLYKTFHELNGKLVEVKRTVPKELSTGSSRGQLGGYNIGLSRVSSFRNGYTGYLYIHLV